MGHGPAGPAESRSIWPRAVDLCGVLLLAAGVAATARYFDDRVSVYDEGGLLTNAFLLQAGALHYRDFYSSYPPGISLLILAAWKILGVSVTAGRVLGLFLHIAVAAGAGRLAGRAADRPFSWFTAGIVMLWISPLGVVPMAWLAALAAALLALDVLARWLERESKGVAFLAGVLLGMVSVFRHDLFVYVSLALLGGSISWMAWNKRVIGAASIPWLLAGFALIALPVWLPVFLGAGVGRVVQDLYFDQAQHVMPGRRLPIGLPGPVPPMLWLATVGIGLAAPLLGAGLVFSARRKGRPFAASMLLLALSLTVLPQLLGRSEWAHLVQTVVPGLCLATAVLEDGARSGFPRRGALALATAGMLAFLGWPLVPRPEQWLTLPRLDLARRESGMPAWQYDAKKDVVSFILRNARPGEPIFVGNSQHRLVTYNDLSLYYLTERPGATRHMQFDPGLTTREDVQREMVSELEANRPRVMVLLKGGYVVEPNASSREGSPLLDDYIRTRYKVVDSFSDYRMLLRR